MATHINEIVHKNVYQIILLLSEGKHSIHRMQTSSDEIFEDALNLYPNFSSDSKSITVHLDLNLYS